MQYVGVGLRLVALIIDTIIMVLISYVIALFTGGTTGGGFSLEGAPAALSWVINFAYYIGLEVTQGGTVGKLLLGLRVTKADGSPIDWGASLIRNVLRVVDAIPFIIPYLLGAILIWNSPTRQRLGDRVAGTVVVRKSSLVPQPPSPAPVPPAPVP